MRLIDHENLFGDLVFSELLHALSRLLNFEYEDEPCLQNVRIYNWLSYLAMLVSLCNRSSKKTSFIRHYTEFEPITPSRDGYSVRQACNRFGLGLSPQ